MADSDFELCINKFHCTAVKILNKLLYDINLVVKIDSNFNNLHGIRPA